MKLIKKNKKNALSCLPSRLVTCAGNRKQQNEKEYYITHISYIYNH